MKKRRCINDETLAEYMEGRLKDQTRDRVEAHLFECNRCLEDLLLAQKVVKKQPNDGRQPVPPEVTENTITKIHRLQKGGLADSLRSRLRALSLKCNRFFHHLGFPGSGSFVQVRSKPVQVSNDVVLLPHFFNDLHAEIEIEKAGSQHTQLKVLILYTRMKNFPVRVSLGREDREIASYLTHQTPVYFESIPFGNYSVRYVQNGSPLGQYDFAVKGPRHGEKDV